MVRNPPATGSAELDRFLSSIKDALDTATKPTQGWKLSDFHAEVSEVISDKRDLIDIISNWDDINTIKANFETEIARYEKLYVDSKALGDQYQDHAEVFAQIMEWWAQNVRLIEEVKEIFDQVEAGETAASDAAAAAEASAAAAKTSETRSKASETNAKTSETRSKTSETNAKASETAAATSVTSSAASASAAKTSENNAKTSEINAKASETAAASSKSAAATSATNARSSETKAKTSETNAAGSATLSLIHI